MVNLENLKGLREEGKVKKNSLLLISPTILFCIRLIFYLVIFVIGFIVWAIIEIF